MQDKLQGLHYYRWIVFSVVALGTFVSTLTSSIVNVALPMITAALKSDIPTAQWVVTAYLLIITSLLPLLGRLGDVWGHRRVYGMGFVGFILGSLLCSISVSMAMLIASRLIQALGAAALMSNSMAIVTRNFPAADRGKALGMTGTVVALGTLTGPSIGGVLAGMLGWNAIFWINIPFCLLGLAGVKLVLPVDEAAKQEKIDYFGAFLFSVGMILFLLVIGGGLEGAMTKLAGTAAALIAFYLFIRQEKRIEHPVIDLALFKNRVFVMGNVAGVLAFMAMFTNTILLPFYLHDIKALAPTQTGMVMSAFPVVMAVVAPVSGMLSDKVGPNILTTLGLCLIMSGLGWTAYLQPDSALWMVVFSQMVIGLGSGIFQAPNNSSIMGAVPVRQLGVAGGINALARNFGMAAGIAAAVAVFSYRRAVSLASFDATGATQQIAAFMSGYQDAILTGAVFALTGVVLSLKYRFRPCKDKT